MVVDEATPVWPQTGTESSRGWTGECAIARSASGKTAHNAWGLITKAFDAAQYSKTRALRMRTDNPATSVRGPDRGERTAKHYLYPTEFLALLGQERIPTRWKRIFALKGRSDYFGP
jgi:hypothetical protein